MVFRYLIASSCHFLNEWIRFSPLGASTASESGENDLNLCTWLIALVLIVLLISCSSNCIWGEITVLVNSSTLEPCVMPFGNMTMSSASPLRHKPAKSSAPEVFGFLVWSVTLVCEMQAPNCLFLNKLSFNMPKASFIEQNKGRGKQKSVGRGLFRQLEGVIQIRSGRQMCFRESRQAWNVLWWETQANWGQRRCLVSKQPSSCGGRLKPSLWAAGTAQPRPPKGAIWHVCGMKNIGWWWNCPPVQLHFPYTQWFSELNSGTCNETCEV